MNFLNYVIKKNGWNYYSYYMCIIPFFLITFIAEGKLIFYFFSKSSAKFEESNTGLRDKQSAFKLLLPGT